MMVLAISSMDLCVVLINVTPCWRIIASAGFYLKAAIVQRGVSAVRPAFRADLQIQAIRGNGQAKQFVTMRQQQFGQNRFAKIFRRQRIIGGTNAVLQRQIQAGRGFARARHPHQNDIGFSQITRFHAVVMIERKFTASIPMMIGFLVGDAVGFAPARDACWPSSCSSVLMNESNRSITSAQSSTSMALRTPGSIMDKKHQRAVMVTLRALGNASADLAGLVWRVDERNGFPPEFRRPRTGSAAWPKDSAVMPVRSETKKAERRCGM